MADEVANLKSSIDVDLQGTIDLQAIARGFTALCEQFLKFKFDKSSIGRVRRSNWEKRELSAEAVGYAAADAWVPLIVYSMITNRYRSLAPDNGVLEKEFSFPSDHPLQRWRSSYNFLLLAILGRYAQENLLAWLLKEGSDIPTKKKCLLYHPYKNRRLLKPSTCYDSSTDLDSTDSSLSSSTADEMTKVRKNPVVRVIEKLLWINSRLTRPEVRQVVDLSRKMFCLLTGVRYSKIGDSEWSGLAEEEMARFLYKRWEYGVMLEHAPVDVSMRDESEILAGCPYAIRVVYGQLKLHLTDLIRQDRDIWIRHWAMMTKEGCNLNRWLSSSREDQIERLFGRRLSDVEWIDYYYLSDEGLIKYLNIIQLQCMQIMTFHQLRVPNKSI